MKYFRKIIWFVMAIVLLASVIIGIGIIFAVKNVNISLTNYRYGDWDSLSEEERAAAEGEIAFYKNRVLEKFRGRLIGYVSEEEIASCFEGTGFVLGSFEKEYPCTLNVSVRERREVFAVASSAGYDIYDENGEYFHKSEVALNDIDGAPNIPVIGADREQMKDVAELSGQFAEHFKALRSVVKEIEIQSTLTANMIFYLRCGIKVRIVDYVNFSAEKMRAAYSEFASLPGELKLSGTIIASVRTDNGTAVAARTPD